MKYYPNVSFYHRYVTNDDINDFVNSIVIMDMARDEDDLDLLYLMSSIAKKSLCFMYKVRSSWMDKPIKIWANDFFLPPFSYYGSAEIRAFGSVDDSQEVILDYTVKKKIIRSVKMRKTYHKCADCDIFDWVISKYIKLPKEWYYFTKRQCDLDILKIRTESVCDHDYWLGNVYLNSCSPCISKFYEKIGTSFSRWLCPVLKGIEFLSPFYQSEKQIKKSYMMATGCRIMMRDKFV